MEIKQSNFNHGRQQNIIATVTASHELEFTVKDIIQLLDGGSDSLAKILNTLGECFNKYEMDEAMAIDDLDSFGVELVENMAYFLKQNKSKKGVADE